MLTLAPAPARRRARTTERPSTARPAVAASEMSAAVIIQTSALEEIMVALAGAHPRHAAGPVFPCPLCFVPRLGGGAL